ncbi:MAG: 3,4-dihydroxy-2-butanone-4-phosphate synthase [Proteobacteria bacterium]|nr:3,4-dihydroxy-2-butanone-4-phosphate synthase [Pseudomonadota bacterium]
MNHLLKTSEHSRLTAKIDQVIQHIQSGQMVIMVDDESRENEGDLVMAAEDVNSEAINFMAKEARGLICLPMEAGMIDRLQLPMMSDHSKTFETLKTAFTVSIEAKKGVSTGISAQDRATTIKLAISDHCQPDDLVVPGHVFPLKACSGGVLTRAGHTEGSVDLMKIAGKKPASVICEIMNPDGTMARRPDLEKFAKRHGMPIISIEDIITYRMLYDSFVHMKKQEKVKTSYGEFDAYWFESEFDESHHVALVRGSSFADHVTEVRVYRQKFLKDIFGKPDLSPDEGQEAAIRRVEYGLQMLSKSTRGVYLYLSSMKQGGQAGNLVAQRAQKQGKSGLMEARLYGIGAQILRKLGVRKLVLNTITPRHLVAIAGFGLEVVGVRMYGDDKTHSPDSFGDQVTKNTGDLVAAQSEGSVVITEKLKKNILILKSSWHPEVVEGLVVGAEEILAKEGKCHRVVVRSVPGAYELLFGAQFALEERVWDIIVCFGCVIKGETFHYQWVVESLLQGFVKLQITYKVPIIPGVLACDLKQDAIERSQTGSAKHRGEEAARAALELLINVSHW